MERISLYEQYVLPKGGSSFFDPLALVPYDIKFSDNPLLLLLIDYHMNARSFTHPTRSTVPYSHARLVVVDPATGVKAFTFAARYAAIFDEDGRPVDKNRHVPNKKKLTFRHIDKLPGPLKLCHPHIYRRVQSCMHSERKELHDVARVYILNRQQLTDVRAEIKRWINSPHYQVASLVDGNCMSFTSAPIVRAKLNFPTWWRTMPWPRPIGRLIEYQAAAGYHPPGIVNIHSETTAIMFRRAQEMFWPVTQGAVPVQSYRGFVINTPALRAAHAA